MEPQGQVQGHLSQAQEGEAVMAGASLTSENLRCASSVHVHSLVKSQRRFFNGSHNKMIPVVKNVNG